MQRGYLGAYLKDLHCPIQLAGAAFDLLGLIPGQHEGLPSFVEAIGFDGFSAWTAAFLRSGSDRWELFQHDMPQVFAVHDLPAQLLDIFLKVASNVPLCLPFQKLDNYEHESIYTLDKRLAVISIGCMTFKERRMSRSKAGKEAAPTWASVMTWIAAPRAVCT